MTVHVLTSRDRRRLHEDLVAACDAFKLALELIVSSYRAPSTWILGRPSPREMDCTQAAVPLHLAKFDLGVAADRLRRSEL